jgi:hypothetical protein
MSSKIYGLSAGQLIPGPNFTFSRDNEGKMTGSHTFTSLRGALSGAATQARFAKGTPITSLDTTLPAFFSVLKVDSFESQDLPGGYCEIRVQLTGYTETGEFGFDREINYSSQTSLVEKSMLEHPKYLSDVGEAQDRAAFTAMYNGFAEAKNLGIRNSEGVPVSMDVYSVTDNELKLATITTLPAMEWFHHIFELGYRTYEYPAFEWRKSTANAGGLTSGEINAVGKRDSNPAGNPPHPSSPTGRQYTWLKISASDDRGESSASTEEVWQWGDWPSKIYD